MSSERGALSLRYPRTVAESAWEMLDGVEAEVARGLGVSFDVY